MTDEIPSGEPAAALAGEWGAEPDSSGSACVTSRQGGLLGRSWVRRYGGHPVAVRIGTRMYRRRLFVGGRERTMRLFRLARQRPAVDVIVNLCELPDHHAIASASDCWWPHGEGPLGYRADTLLRDALAVAELLQRGQTVLIHCVAGINRAPTLCAAVLMVMERCTAHEALARVRQHRWMALPDPWHWRALRQLEARLAGAPESGDESFRSA